MLRVYFRAEIGGRPTTNKPSDNSEDSLTKQFILKANIILHNENPNIDLKNTKTRLKQIYAERSSIAHGNFEKQDIEVKSDIEFMHGVLLSITRAYIDNLGYINFLKEN